MTVNELYDIADRYEYLINLAYEFGWSRKQLMDEISEISTQLREEADELAANIASSVSETDLWYDTSKELA